MRRHTYRRPHDYRRSRRRAIQATYSLYAPSAPAVPSDRIYVVKAESRVYAVPR
jgi:hypothetical protein